MRKLYTTKNTHKNGHRHKWGNLNKINRFYTYQCPAYDMTVVPLYPRKLVPGLLWTPKPGGAQVLDKMV